MYQQFERGRNVHINRDEQGIARDLLHYDKRGESNGRTAKLAAHDYLARYRDLLGVAAGEATTRALAKRAKVIDAGPELRLAAEKRHMDMTTVVYRQTHFGLPVWHSGVAVHMKQKPYRVVSAQSSRHADLDVKRPAAPVLARLKRLDAATLRKRLGLAKSDRAFDPTTLKVDDVKLMIYRYKAAKRSREKAKPASQRDAAVAATGARDQGGPALRLCRGSLPPRATRRRSGTLGCDRRGRDALGALRAGLRRQRARPRLSARSDVDP